MIFAKPTFPGFAGWILSQIHCKPGGVTVIPAARSQSAGREYLKTLLIWLNAWVRCVLRNVSLTYGSLSINYNNISKSTHIIHVYLLDTEYPESLPEHRAAAVVLAVFVLPPFSLWREDKSLELTLLGFEESYEATM